MARFYERNDVRPIFGNPQLPVQMLGNALQGRQRERDTIGSTEFDELTGEYITRNIATGELSRDAQVVSQYENAYRTEYQKAMEELETGDNLEKAKKHVSKAGQFHNVAQRERELMALRNEERDEFKKQIEKTRPEDAEWILKQADYLYNLRGGYRSQDGEQTYEFDPTVKKENLSQGMTDLVKSLPEYEDIGWAKVAGLDQSFITSESGRNVRKTGAQLYRGIGTYLTSDMSQRELQERDRAKNMREFSAIRSNILSGDLSDQEKEVLNQMDIDYQNFDQQESAKLYSTLSNRGIEQQAAKELASITRKLDKSGGNFAEHTDDLTNWYSKYGNTSVAGDIQSALEFDYTKTDYNKSVKANPYRDAFGNIKEVAFSGGKGSDNLNKTYDAKDLQSNIEQGNKVIEQGKERLNTYEKLFNVYEMYKNGATETEIAKYANNNPSLYKSNDFKRMTELAQSGNNQALNNYMQEVQIEAAETEDNVNAQSLKVTTNTGLLLNNLTEKERENLNKSWYKLYKETWEDTSTNRMRLAQLVIPVANTQTAFTEAGIAIRKLFDNSGKDINTTKKVYVWDVKTNETDNIENIYGGRTLHEKDIKSSNKDLEFDKHGYVSIGNPTSVQYVTSGGEAFKKINYEGNKYVLVDPQLETGDAIEQTRKVRMAGNFNLDNNDVKNATRVQMAIENNTNGQVLETLYENQPVTLDIKLDNQSYPSTFEKTEKGNIRVTSGGGTRIVDNESDAYIAVAQLNQNK